MQNDTTNAQKTELRLSEKTWFHVLMVFLFWPVGLYLIWKTPRYSKRVRLGIPIAFFVLAIIGMIMPKKGDSSNPYEFGHYQMSGMLSEARRNPGPTGVMAFIGLCKQENSSVRNYTDEQVKEWESGIWAAYTEWISANPMNAR